MSVELELEFQPEPEPEKPKFQRFEPGWHKDIPNEVYHKSAGVSSSTLKKFLSKTPAHVDYDKKHPKEPTKNMQLGTAVHTLFFEPAKAEQELAVMPELNLRTKAGQAVRDQFMDDNKGKVILSAEDFEKAMAMTRNLCEFVAHDKVLSALLTNTVSESSVYWWYKSMDLDDQTEYKQMCKVRPDDISIDYPVLFDLKTTSDATYTGFQKSIINFGYHISAAMYLEGVNQCMELLEELGHYAYTKFIFLVVESEPPYLPAAYELDATALELGKHFYRRAMYLHYLAKRDDWPGFTSDIRLLELPGWASRNHIV